MPRISDGQIVQARSIDLLSYLQSHEPGNVRRSGPNEYCLAEHDSLKISNGKWFRHSTQEGGVGALDYLIKIRGVPFVEAVEHLTGNQTALHIIRQPQAPTIHKSAPPIRPPKPFTLPEHNKNNDRVIAYLRGRSIGKEVINRCIKSGILYESANHRCVFVGKDENGIPKYACERGTSGDLKRDVAASDKRYCFSLPPKQAQSPISQTALAIFESPCDLLAHHTIHEIGQTGWDGHRLSLGGVSSKGLFGFLERNPQIASVQICLDCDRAGQEAACRKVKELLGDARYSGMKIIVAPAPIGKDYADTLQAVRQMNSKETTINRQQAAF